MTAARRAARGERADEHRADERDRVGFKNIRRHARAVAHVVAHVVGDGRRVARIVFVEIRLHLAHEVRADIRRLRVDAAAEPREDGNERRAERQADQAGDRLVRLALRIITSQKIADRKQRQTDHEQAGDRAAVEGRLQRLLAARSRACAVRTLATTAMRMPMKPAASEHTAPSTKPDRRRHSP